MSMPLFLHIIMQNCIKTKRNVTKQKHSSITFTHIHSHNYTYIHIHTFVFSIKKKTENFKSINVVLISMIQCRPNKGSN